MLALALALALVQWLLLRGEAAVAASLRCVAGGAKLKRSAASSSPLQLAGGRRRSSIAHYPSHPHARSPRHDRLHTLHPPRQSLFEHRRRPAVSISAMDSLVAQYSRPVDADEGQTEQQQLELYSGAPDLSLKFALPPVAQVRLSLPLLLRADTPADASP